jgi:hypothetical protein
MIEVYVILTLAGVGYFLNHNRPVTTSASRQINVNELPTSTTTYDSRHTDVVKAIEQNKAKKMYDQTSIPTAENIPKVIPKMYKPIVAVQSQLAGVSIPKADFTHNNMMPFFRGSMRQNMDPQRNSTMLENFTGTSSSDIYIPKREQEPLFEKTTELTYMSGAPNNSERMKDYFHTPTIQNNILPFKQVKVGPGVGKGFTDKPTGGYQQFDLQEIAKPKTIDELRISTNPKVTYEGRVIDGQKGTMRGKIGVVDKNRAETFYKNSSDRYLKTTGAVIKATQHGKYIDKTTARQSTCQQSYQGGAYQPKQQPFRSKVRDPHRNQLSSFSLGNLSLVQNGRRDDTDYGKKNILVYTNARDVTSTRTHQGNLTSVVKAIIAPIEDMFKITKKEFMVDNPRTYGQMQAQVPSKMTIVDPNDVARTTVKQTTLQETDLLNLKGATQITTYDPDDVARTTIKETTMNEAETMNLKGHVKSVIFDPNDVARVTLKETTIHDADVSNLKGHVRTHVYDPNDVARTTIKETTIHDAKYSNLKGDRTAGYVFDPSVKAKTTVRQTLDCVDTEINMAVSRFAGATYNPDDSAKTTVKETTLEGDYVGIIERNDRNTGAYEDENYDMKQTHKEFLSNKEYMGTLTQTNGDGYKVAPTDVKHTLKEGTTDIEYFGNAADQNTNISMSYSDMYNACISELRETTLVGRAPASEGAKQTAGGDSINVEMRKIAGDEPATRMLDNKDRIVNNMTQIDIASLTRHRNTYNNTGNRLQELDIAAVLRDNPYVNNPIAPPTD